MVVDQGNRGERKVDSAAFADQTLVHAAVRGYSGFESLRRMTASLKEQILCILLVPVADKKFI